MMLNIIVNGEKRSVTAQTIPELLQSESVPQTYWQSIAVACNGNVIPRGTWAATKIKDGDTIEIVKPFVGG